MSEVRIPVSLKFDTDSDVYTDLIIDLKDNRELSPFIVQLLTLYYEDDEVRDLINFKREQNNPFSALREQLTKINLQHTQTIVATNMLASQTQGIISGLEKEGHMASNPNLHTAQVDDSAFTMNIGDAPTQPYDQQQQQYIQQQQAQATTNVEPSVIDTLMKRMDSMEKLLPNINEKLEQLLSGNTQPQMQPQQQTAFAQQVHVVQPPTQENQTEQPIELPTIQPQPTIEQPIQQQQVEPVPVFTAPPTVAPPTITVEQQPIEAPPITIGQPIEVVQTQPQPQPTAPQLQVEAEKPSKPASFGKALSSLKKKN